MTAIVSETISGHLVRTIRAVFHVNALKMCRRYQKLVDTIRRVGVRNFLIEGVSGSGKTSVATELERRGYQAIHGDRALAYVGDPETGDPVPDSLTPAGHAANCGCWDCLAWLSERWLWDLDQVRAIASDGSQSMTFFCGGSRNFSEVIDLFDAVFVLDVDLETLLLRLRQRPEHEFGGKQSERDLVALQNRTREDRLRDRRVPGDAILIDTSQPLASVVDEVLWRAEVIDRVKKPATCKASRP